MALYLIATESREVENEPVPSDLRMVEAKNIKEAARALIDPDTSYDGLTAQIWRVAGPPKRITLSMTTTVEVDVD